MLSAHACRLNAIAGSDAVTSQEPCAVCEGAVWTDKAIATDVLSRYDPPDPDDTTPTTRPRHHGRESNPD